ncbi:S53 family peptidase [Streptomyces sp. NPDC094032]|uniref:S53 family peptidase n=1 Tax=Streptomyces sp. NPDC094032 TaxID=3155308 RepID=UPI0033238B13
MRISRFFARTVGWPLGLVFVATACAGSSAEPGWSSGPTASYPAPLRDLPSHGSCPLAVPAHCYTPDQVRRAYGIDTLGAAGLTGKGRVIAVYDTVVPPTLEADLRTFSARLGLPAPDLTVKRRPLEGGEKPGRFDRDSPAALLAALETTLDVQMAHMAAPDARIVVTELVLPAPAHAPSPSPSGRPVRPASNKPHYTEPKTAKETGEVIGAMIAEGVEDSLRDDRPDVLSLSYGFPEWVAAGDTGGPVEMFEQMGRAFADAAKAGTTVVAAAGDWGAAPPVGKGGAPVRTANWPCSAPEVVCVGGTRLHLDADGRRIRPDTVWNDLALGHGATGGGPSQTFARPAYQAGVARTVGGRRGTPDISMDAAYDGATLIYQSFLPEGAGWYPAAGTSEAAPLFAALVALAHEKAGRRIPNLHEKLYAMAGEPGSGIVDVTDGDNGVDGLGYRATDGYDLASGLGTVNAAVFVPALAAGSGAAPRASR